VRVSARWMVEWVTFFIFTEDWVGWLTGAIYYYWQPRTPNSSKRSASAQIIYHYRISPGSISGIVIYICTTGKNWLTEYIDNLYI
jgi:hypothetical protein